MAACTSFMTSEEPALRCHFLRLSVELRLRIYEELFGPFDDQALFIDLEEDQHTTAISHLGYNPPHIRQVCKQLYKEATDPFFRAWTVSIYFADVKHLQTFLDKIGQDNRRRVRHLFLGYSTLIDGGDVRDDIDVEIWSAVARTLKKCFREKQCLLETLELETADDRNGAVRFGGSPREDPRAVAISSVVQVMKLVRLFPRLTSLCLEEVTLLEADNDDKESDLEKLPIINFF